MNETTAPMEPPDLSLYEANRQKFPPEELAKYAGHYVAFSADGTRILVSGTTEEEVESQLLALGLDPSQVVGSYVPPLALVILQ